MAHKKRNTTKNKTQPKANDANHGIPKRIQPNNNKPKNQKDKAR
jgi:hypothetical protein